MRIFFETGNLEAAFGTDFVGDWLRLWWFYRSKKKSVKGWEAEGGGGILDWWVRVLRKNLCYWRAANACLLCLCLDRLAANFCPPLGLVETDGGCRVI